MSQNDSKKKVGDRFQQKILDADNSQAKREIRNFSTVILSFKKFIYSEKASKIWLNLPYNLGELRRKKIWTFLNFDQNTSF